MLHHVLILIVPMSAMQPSPSAFRPFASPTVVVVTAQGVGYPPRHMRGAQARLMARRAAEVNAVRNLAAKLGLPPTTRIGSFRYVESKSIAGGGVEVTVEKVMVPSIPRRP